MSVLSEAARTRRITLLLTAFLFPAGCASLGAVALLAVSVSIAVRRLGALWQRTALDLPIGFLILSLSLSAAFSPYPATAAISTLLLALLIVLAFGATAVTLTQSSGALLPLLWTLGAGTAVAAAWCTIAYLVTGQPARAPVGSNALGTTLATGLPIVYGLGINAQRRGRVLAGTAAALIVVGLAYTFVRGAWLGSAAALVLLAALLPRPARPAYFVMVALSVIVGVLAQANVSAALAQRDVSAALAQRVQSVSAPGAVEDRVTMWRASLAMLRDRPLLGSGLNTFGLLYPHYRPPEERSSARQPHAHNIFLNMAAEGGILGVAALLMTLIVTARLGLRWLGWAGKQHERVRAASVLAAIAALMVHQQLDGTALSVHVGFGLWLLIGVVAARSHASVPTTGGTTPALVRGRVG